MIQYSQRDTRWNFYKLGYGSDDQTIGTQGCLLTACATVLSHYGHNVTPKELNEMLKGNNGFTGALMYYNSIESFFPVVSLFYECPKDSSGCIDIINIALGKGLLPIVEVDSSPQNGMQNHWVVIYDRHGDEYFISDPWDMEPEKETVILEDRYGFAGKTADIIKHILLIQPRNVTKPLEPAGRPAPLELEAEEIPVGSKLRVITNGLRLRPTPSTEKTELAMLAHGYELVSAGKPIKNGNITWQPVMLYVATSYLGEKYIEPAE